MWKHSFELVAPGAGGLALGWRRVDSVSRGDDGGMLRWLFVPVLVLLLLALAVGFLDRPAAPAQEDPAIFTELRLEETSPGAYRLDVSIQGAVIPYRVGVRTWRTGTDHGVDPQISIGVPDSATPRCGYALVLVWAIGPDGPSSLPGNTTVAACFSTAGIRSACAPSFV